jgi:glycosyltransferase involved in cell wall biosynthesis
MKKIVYITNSRIPTEKAHGIQVMAMCKEFVVQGYEVELLIPNRKNTITDNIFTYYGIQKVFSIQRLFTLDFVHYGWIGYWIQALSFSERVALRAFFDRIKKKDFIYYTRDEITALYLSNLGRKVVWESHVGKNNTLTRFLVKRGVNIVAISQGVADVYVGLGAKKEQMLVAHDGVNLDQFSINESIEVSRDRLGLQSSKKIALYSGHLYDWKGAHTFAEAAKHIPGID